MSIRKFAVLGTAAFLTFGSASAWADTIIRFSNWLPPTHKQVTNVFIPFFKEIEQVTEGRVKVEMLPKAVGTPQSQIDVVRDGLADMSFVVPSYTPGRYVATEVAELPLLGNDASITGPIFYRHFKKFIEPTGEFKGVKVLSTWMVPPSQPFLKGRTIRSIDDFKGLKLRAANQNTVNTLSTLGAVPILKSSAEAYEMLSSGAIDGQVTLVNTVAQQNQLDLLTSLTMIPGGLANTVNAVVVNPARWDEISEADRNAIEAIAGEKLARTAGQTESDADKEALERYRQANYEIIQIDDAFRTQLAERLKPVEEAWVKRAQDKGVEDPAGQLASLRAAIAEGEKGQ
jgi:TRAP-type C4-dicarboxylate transport system substrate-binding protein